MISLLFEHYFEIALTVDLESHAVDFVSFLHERVRSPAQQLQTDVIHLRPKAQNADGRVPVTRSLKKVIEF